MQACADGLKLTEQCEWRSRRKLPRVFPLTCNSCRSNLVTQLLRSFCTLSPLITCLRAAKQYTSEIGKGAKLREKEIITKASPAEISRALSDLRMQNTLEIETINDRMTMIESHLEQAITKMNSLETVTTVAVSRPFRSTVTSLNACGVPISLMGALDYVGARRVREPRAAAPRALRRKGGQQAIVAQLHGQTN